MKFGKVKRVIAMVISIFPLSSIRVLAYRTLLNYKIGRGSRIGVFTVIAVDTFECGEKVYIGRNNFLVGPMSVSLGARTLMGRWNKFECSPIATTAKKIDMKYARKLIFGTDCLIHEHHYFDVYGEIKIGKGTWIAGRNTQFWTHGASVIDRDIKIGNNCYIGSACRFAPGSGLLNDVVVGLGSVISKRIPDSNAIVAGVPAKFIKERHSKEDNLIFKRWDDQ